MAAAGAILKLKSGLEIRGNGSRERSPIWANVLTAPSDGPKSIYVVDDGLKRTFVSSFQVDGYRDDLEALETSRIKQPVARSRTLARWGHWLHPHGFGWLGTPPGDVAASNGAGVSCKGLQRSLRSIPAYRDCNP